MNRLTLAERFDRAQWQVAQGDVHLQQQRELILELERAGRDAAFERKVLRQLELVHSLDVADRNRLRIQWARSDTAAEAALLAGGTRGT